MLTTANIDWGATGDFVGGIASLVTAVIAVVAAIFAWQQVRISRQIDAENAYLDFHKLSFENPEFAEPNYESIRRSPLKYVKYRWFVIGMLVGAERVLDVHRNSPSWLNAINDDLDSHQDYICSSDFEKHIESFYPKTQLFLRTFINSRMSSQ